MMPHPQNRTFPHQSGTFGGGSEPDCLSWAFTRVITRVNAHDLPAGRLRRGRVRRGKQCDTTAQTGHYGRSKHIGVHDTPETQVYFEALTRRKRCSIVAVKPGGSTGAYEAGGTKVTSVTDAPSLPSDPGREARPRGFGALTGNGDNGWPPAGQGPGRSIGPPRPGRGSRTVDWSASAGQGVPDGRLCSASARCQWGHHVVGRAVRPCGSAVAKVMSEFLAPRNYQWQCSRNDLILH